MKLKNIKFPIERIELREHCVTHLQCPDCGSCMNIYLCCPHCGYETSDEFSVNTIRELDRLERIEFPVDG